MSALDRDLGSYSGEKVVLPIAGPGSVIAQQANEELYELPVDLAVVDSPNASANRIGRLSQPTVVKAEGQWGEFIRIALPPPLAVGSEQAHGFVPLAQLKVSPNGKASSQLPSLKSELIHSPPLLEVKASELATESNTVTIEVDARDGSGGIQDAYVFLGYRKIFYRPNPKKGGSTMKFSLDVPLNDGANLITVVARENEEISTRRIVIVRKDGPGGALLATPRNELLGQDWEFGKE